jgi:hypothetical protein
LGLKGVFLLLRPYLFVGVLLLSLGVNADAATYYIDQTAGNDTAAGTSPTTPWKSAPGMTSYTGSSSLAPGDIVYFDRGDLWSVSGGSQGFYLVGGVTYIGDSWGTGTRARIRAASGFDAGVVRFRDHSTTATVFQGFDVDANSQVAHGIDINTGFWSLMNGATKRVQNCIVHHVASQQNLGQYNYGIIISNHGGTAGYAENVELIGNVVHTISRDGIALYPGDGSANDRIRNILVRGNEVHTTGTDPGYCCGAGILIKGFVVDATIEYNYAHNNDGAAIFVNSNESNHFGTGPSNVHIRYNLVTNTTQNGGILVYDGSGGTDPKDMKIYGNIVYNSTVNAGLLLHGNLNGAINLRVYNNTFYNAPVHVENSGANYTIFEFKNNVVFYTAGVPFSDPGRKVTSHSNNIFSGSGTVVSSGGVNYTASNLTTYEPSASSSNPMFKNATSLPTGFSGTFGTNLAPTTDGLSVQATSFAVDRGATLPSPYHGSINSLTRSSAGGWDIGAYESGPGGSQPPAPPTNLRILP